MKYLRTLFWQYGEFLVALAFFLLPFTSYANVSNFTKQISYQAKLTDSTGATVADGSYNMRFKLYNTLTGGSPIFTETLVQDDRVPVSSGLFSVMIGATGTSLSAVDFNQPLYLSVDIGGTSNSASPTFDGEMSPRKTVGTVPSAFNSDLLDGLDSTAFTRVDATNTIATSSSQTLLTLNQQGSGDILSVQGSGSSFLTVTNSGRAGIGTSSPATAFSVVGNIFASSTATSTFYGGGINLVTSAGNVGCFAVNNVCVTGTGLSQTPWSSDINGNGFNLNNVNHASTTLLSTLNTLYIGSTATSTINGNNGLSTLSSDLLVTGSTTLQNFTALNSTTTNSTSTSFFSSILNSSNSTSTSFFAAVLRATGSIATHLSATSDLGVGTTSPGIFTNTGTPAKITIDSGSGSNLNPGIAITGTSNTDSGISLVNTVGAGRHWQILSSGGGSTVGQAGSLNFYDLTASANRFNIDSSGNIGIGTTTPGSIFSINNVANFTTGTTTFYAAGGLNLSSGCFAVNGSCVSGGSGSQTPWTSDINGGGFSLTNVNRASTTLLSVLSTLYVGSTATSTINGNNGLSTLSSDLLVTGSTTLQNFTALNSTTTNSTSTSFFAAIFNATNATATNLSVTGSISFQGSGTSTITNLSVSSLTNLGSTTITNATSSSLFTTLLTVTNSILTNIFGTNATITNSTSTSLFASSANLTNATTTNLNVSNTLTTQTINNSGSLTITGLSSLNGGASTTNLTVSNNFWIGGNSTTTSNGTLTTNGSIGIATTTPGSLLSVGNVVNLTSATSTFYSTGGINLSSGCFAISGTCVGSGGGSGTVSAGTAGQLSFYAADGTTLTATSSIFLSTSGTSTGNVGIGTSTPQAKLTVTGGGVYAEGIAMSGSYSSIISAVVGSSTGYTNFSGGIGTGGAESINNALRITDTGNLVNIGSVQAGETLLTSAGTFGTKTDYTSGNAPKSAAIADLNGDGYMDIVTANNNDNNVSVFFNNGSGVFNTRASFNTGNSPFGVVIGDVNGDGRPDIITGDNGSDQISVLKNNGDGTFGPSVEYSTGSGIRALAIGDVNGDGKPDIVTGNGASANASVLLNNGSGVFSNSVTLGTGGGTRGVAIGDLNGDGKADIATADFNANQVSVFYNTGNATFASPITLTTGSGPQFVVIGDVNGDGRPDIVTPDRNSNQVSVFINNGNGTFASRIALTTATSPEVVAIGDLNGDGKPDIVSGDTASSQASVFINNGSGGFASRVQLTTGSTPGAVVIGDVNGDGKADIIAANSSSNTISVFMNQVRSLFYASASTGNVSIGTTSPTSTQSNLFAKLTVWSADTSSGGRALNVVDSASSTLFTITNSGSIGIGTSTPASVLSINNVANISSATSTFYSVGGINLSSGCFAISGSCIGGGSGSQTPWTSDINGNGFSLTNVNRASTTVLSVSGSFFAGGTGTTTITSAGFLGVGTSTPSSSLAVQGNTLVSGNINTANLTASGTISAPQASTPVYTFTGDTGTGISNTNSVGWLGFHTNGSIKWFIDPNGVLGPNNDNSFDLGLASTRIRTGYFVNASTTNLSVSQNLWIGGNSTTTSNGTLTTNGSIGIGTSTPGSLFSVNGVTNFTSATSTFYSTGGINLSSGCFAISGSCISGGGGGSGTVSAGTAGQIAYYASSGSTVSGTSSITFASNGALTISATSSFYGPIGVGTTSPKFSLDVASTTRTSNLITSNLAFSQAYGSILSAVVGSSTGYTNFSGGIGTGGVDSVVGGLRLTNSGNLVNLGSVQAGETSLSSGGTFAPATDFPTSNSSGNQGVAIGDLNGDGKNDFIVVMGSLNQMDVFISRLNGTFASTTYTTGSSPKDVAIGDLNGDGKPDIAVADSGANTISVFINNGNGTFAPKVDYTTGAGSPNYIAIGDLNGDGRNDIATTNGGSFLSLFYNKGDGTFPSSGISETVPALTAGSAPKDIAIGDLNGDGRADIVTANSSESNVGIFLNMGNGNFASQITTGVGGSPDAVAIADLNGDGINDIVAANSSFSAPSISILYNGGNGIITSSSTATVSGSFGPNSVAVGDLNGDGRNDIAVSIPNTSNDIFVFMNQGNGVFPSSGTAYSTTNGFSNYIALGDLNGDGKADILTSASTNDKAYILYNQPAPLLYASALSGNVAIGTSTATSTQSSLFAKLTVWASTTANGTALNVVNSASSSLFTVGNNGNVGVGTSSPGSLFAISGIANFTTATSTLYSTTGGINLNGGCFAISGTCVGSQWTTSGSNIFYNTGKVGIGTSTPGTALAVNGAAVIAGPLTIQSFNATSTTATSTIQGFLDVNGTDANNATSTFASNLWVKGTVQVGTGSIFLTSKGISSTDGTISLGSGTSGSTLATTTITNLTVSATSSFSSLLGIGTSSPTYSLDVATTTRTTNLITQNLTISQAYGSILSAVVGSSTGYTNFSGGIGIGGSDSIGNAFNNALRITSTGNLVNIGSVQAGETLLTSAGTFATKTDFNVGNTPQYMAIGDINGDGRADLAIANRNSANVTVYFNNGDGTYSSTTPSVSVSFPTGIAIGDFNGDGKADLAVTGLGNTVGVLLNNGNGGFSSSVTYSAGVTNAYAVAIGDLNGDGKPDLVIGDNSSGGIGVLLNNGNGTFASGVTYGSGMSTFSIAIADFNGDGRADIAATDLNTNSVSVFVNAGNGTFSSRTNYAVGSNPEGVVAGDLDGDGKPDLAVANHGADTMSILINNGTSTGFAPQVTYSTGSGNQGIAIGDVNGDGRPDLAVVNNGATSVSIFRNLGNGTFASRVNYTTGSSPFGVAMGDLNGDGKTDVAVTNQTSGTVSVFANQTSPILYAQAFSGNLGIGTSTAATSSSLFAKLTLWASSTPSGSALNIVSAASSTLFTVSNSGLVGIGTTSPLARLSITATSSGSASNLALLSINVATTSGAATSTAFIVSANGNVGIATTTPGTLFSIDNMANFTNATSTFYSTGGINLSSGCFAISGTCVTGSQWASSGSNISYTSGSVGIGTSTPSGALTVQGNSTFGILHIASNSNTSETAISFNNANDRLTSGDSQWLIGKNIGLTDGSFDIYSPAVAGNSGKAFVINTTGKIGIATDTPVSTLSIQGSLCVRNTGSCGTTSGTIYASNATVQGIDLAERYQRFDDISEPGDIVSVSNENVSTSTAPLTESFGVRRADLSRPEKVIGVVSTEPGFTLGKEFTNASPVALTGRVPVKVNLDGGPIAVGDYITLSPDAGVGMKATTSGQVIGTALEAFDGNVKQADGTTTHEDTTKIAVFMNVGYQQISPDSSNDSLVQMVLSYLASLGARIEQGVAYFQNLFADKVSTHELCLDDVCVTRDQFKAMLDKSGAGTNISQPVGNQSSDSTSPVTDTEAPVLQLIGNATSTINIGESYVDPGATVTDNVDHNLGVTTTGSVDTSQAGDYTLKYDAEDSAGNKAIELSRVVTVVDPSQNGSNSTTTVAH